MSYGTKQKLKTIGLVIVLVGVLAALLYVTAGRYEQCLDDGFTPTECDAVLNGDGVVIIRGR